MIELFLKLIGLIYFLAFASIFWQVKALFGANGISPIANYLDSIKKTAPRPYLQLPTIFWFNSSDWFLQFICLAGIVLSLGVCCGYFTSPALILLYIFYLSLQNIGTPFLNFQWDILLLEAGFLAGALSIAYDFNYSFAIFISLYLLKFLIFKLMFMSGLVKISSGDRTWTNLSALNFHYETQPLPNPLSFFAHNLPAWFHKLSCAGMFCIELICPIFIFLPEPFPLLACVSFIFLNLLISLTGNYCFFNLLSIVLSFTLLIPVQDIPQSTNLFIDIPLSVIALVFISMHCFYILRAFSQNNDALITLFNLIRPVISFLMPYHLINSYGLFAVMTTYRYEIILEGTSDDLSLANERQWQEYQFKYKSGDIKDLPKQIAPFQPRLDWQMWFAALSDYRRNTWILNLAMRLLEGRQEMNLFFSHNPFKEDAPKAIRAVLYEYKFNDIKTWSQSGEFWQRTRIDLYMPEISL